MTEPTSLVDHSDTSPDDSLDDELIEANWVVRVDLSSILHAIKETARVAGLRLAFPEAQFPDAKDKFHPCGEGDRVYPWCSVEYVVPTHGSSFAGAFIRIPCGYDRLPKRTAFAYIDPKGVVAQYVVIQQEDEHPGFWRLAKAFKLL